MLGRPWYTTGFWRYIILSSLAKGTCFIPPNPAENWPLPLTYTLYTIVLVSKEGWQWGWAQVHEYLHVTEIIPSFPLTKQKGWMGEYWLEVMSWWYGTSCAESAQKQPGPIFPSTAQTRLVGKWFIIWHKTKQKKYRGLWSIGKNFWPRKNQSERLETTVPYNKGFIHKINKCWFTLLNLKSEMNNQPGTCIKTRAQESRHQVL